MTPRTRGPTSAAQPRHPAARRTPRWRWRSRALPLPQQSEAAPLYPLALSTQRQRCGIWLHGASS